MSWLFLDVFMFMEWFVLLNPSSRMSPGHCLTIISDWVSIYARHGATRVVVNMCDQSTDTHYGLINKGAHQNVNFCHLLIRHRWGRSWGSEVWCCWQHLFWTAHTSAFHWRQFEWAALLSWNPETNCHVFCWTWLSDLPTRHCQDLQELPVSALTRHVISETPLDCYAWVRPPAGSSSPVQPLTSSGSAGGIGQYLPGNAWQLGDVHQSQVWLCMRCC